MGSQIIPLDPETAEFIDVRCESKKGAAGYNYKADNAVDGIKYEATGPLKLAHSYGGKNGVTWTANWKSFYDWTTDVGSVRIWFRKDCCHDEHKNIKVEVIGNSKMWGGVCKPEAELTADYIKEQIAKDEPVYFYCPFHTRGKYVMISNYGGKELIFHEVKVLKPVATPYYNLFSGYYGAAGSKPTYLWDGDMTTYAQARITGGGVDSYYRNRNAKVTEVHL